MEKKRINIILPQRTVDRIERIQILTLATSATDVIKDSILLYDFIVDYYINGYDIFIKKATSHEYVPLNIMIDLPPKAKK
jgi:hypothetical protein